MEVMLASVVMLFGIATSLTTLQFGLRAVDTARNMTLASQIMQSEMEILRPQIWNQIIALDGRATIDPTTSISVADGSALDTVLNQIANRFTCLRTVEPITGRDNIRLITLRVSWVGVDGRSHQLRFQTRYAKNGLSDYFYVAH
jgi:hypothetical protein